VVGGGELWGPQRVLVSGRTPPGKLRTSATDAFSRREGKEGTAVVDVGRDHV